MDKLKKIIIVFILIIIGFFAVYGAVNILSGFNSKSGLTIFSQTKNNDSDLSYSFTDDDDQDDLSNAKEIIYGSDSGNPDTDKDSYSDGEEVQSGYDPVVAGSGRLTDRTTQNLTIQYFSWVKEKYDINDPILKDSFVQEYLNIYYPLTFVLSDVAENKLTIDRNADSQDTINYIESLNNIELPQGFLNYQELYEKTLAGQTVDIDGILTELNASADKLYKMAVPEKAIKLHKKYIGIIETLKIIFGDLKNTRKDPVLIKLDIKKGQELAIIAADLEKEKTELLTTVQMPNFAENNVNATDKQDKKDINDNSVFLKSSGDITAVAGAIFAKIGSELEAHTPSQPNPEIGEDCGGNERVSDYPPGYTTSAISCNRCQTTCGPGVAFLWDSITKICGCGE